MNRQQAHGIRALLLRDRLELLGSQRILLADEADEAGKVRAANRLVLARQAAELAQVREPARAVPAGEHCEVVVVLGEDLLAQPLEAHAGRCRDEPVVALEERAQQPPVLGGEVLGQPLSSAVKSGRRVAFRRIRTRRVVRDPDQRRRKHGGESDVVVAVVQQPEIREQVDHLLLAEVPAARRAVRRQPLEPKRLLVALGVRPGGEEHDDLARSAAPESTSSRTRAAIARASPWRQCSPESR